MKAMNFESTKWRREALDDVVVDEETLARRRRNRRIVIGLAVAVLLAIAAVFMFGGSGEQAAAPQGDQGRQLPAVTVIVPGRQDVPMKLSATGSLAARRDMQVGVPGEGGQVVRVLAEPGQWVRAGQTLAVIDRRVQAQEAQQLAAQIEVNRADLRLAES
jgi:multidrug efflux pump subunit AcrA (membrane-fusion protein)